MSGDDKKLRLVKGDESTDDRPDETETEPVEESSGATADDLLSKYAADLPRDPAKYFDVEGGLLAATLADDIIDMGPLAEGIDDIVWAYEGGVWKPAKHVVRDRAVTLLDDRYRGAHARNAEQVIRARSPKLASAPVPQYINFTNGLLDWRSGELIDHDPAVLSTVQLSVPWNPDALCPEFDKFLVEVLPEDVVELAWELIGYMLFSGNPLHKAVMLVGSGRNGKGTLLRLIVRLLGERNVTAASLHQIVNTRFHTARLFGKIANIAGDIDPKYMESTAVFKQVTGEDLLNAEHKMRDSFEFTCWALPCFSANKVPPSADVTVGYLSRWLVIPFPNSFEGREDRRLDDKLAVELEGVAAKAVPTLCTLLDRGNFKLPPSAKAALESFKRDVDQVRRWVEDCCSISPSHPPIARAEVYRLYKVWAWDNNYPPVKSSEFYNRLVTIAGIGMMRTSKGRFVVNLKVDTDRSDLGLR